LRAPAWTKPRGREAILPGAGRLIRAGRLNRAGGLSVAQANGLTNTESPKKTTCLDSLVLGALTLLLVYQLVGEVLVLLLKLPVPGPVLGMLLLFLTLVARRGVPEELRTASNGILQHLSLLFVPAGVGIMVHVGRLKAEWLPILVALVVSTLLTIAVTALVMEALLRVRGKRDAPAAE
jgi:holin-like protein